MSDLRHVHWTPTREAGLERLCAFLPMMGYRYANERNFDYGPDRRANVSALSPWISAGLLGEREVLAAALDAHGRVQADKFVQEVLWRGYFRGWLEHRPGVWQGYRDTLAELKSSDMPDGYAEAIAGRTGIDCFDVWVSELLDRGWLHNHARMWFASIWIFTLRLPWQLGADFFLRNLMDGDAASNTLSWRWVAGLHTPGKQYVATRENIRRFTEGRFAPKGLAGEGFEVAGMVNPEPRTPAERRDASERQLLVNTQEMQVEGAEVALAVQGNDTEFRRAALAGEVLADAAAVLEAARTRGCTGVTVAGHPTGPVADAFEKERDSFDRDGVSLGYLRRDFDDAVWPHAGKGYFGLRKRIPAILDTLGLDQAKG